MKERPILFSGPMIRALLAGTKTQTRRVVKPQPPANTVAMGRWQDPGPAAAFWAFLRDGPVEHDHPFGGAELHGEPWRCPYGRPGDRLWVRETWAQNWNQLSDTRMDRSYVYRADGEQRAQDNGTDLPWRPSIHMPRWASRITLEVTAVRVERLQDISIEDAKAEGAWPDVSVVGDCASYFGIDVLAANPYRAFQMLWERINGPDAWDANPWVWVVEFRRLP